MALKRSCRLGIKGKSIVKYSNCSDLKFCFMRQEYIQLEPSVVFIVDKQTTRARKAVVHVLLLGK